MFPSATGEARLWVSGDEDGIHWTCLTVHHSRRLPVEVRVMRRQGSDDRSWKVRTSGDVAFDALYQIWTPAPDKVPASVVDGIRETFDDLFDRFPGISLTGSRRELVYVSPTVIREVEGLVEFILRTVASADRILRTR